MKTNSNANPNRCGTLPSASTNPTRDASKLLPVCVVLLDLRLKLGPDGEKGPLVCLQTAVTAFVIRTDQRLLIMEEQSTAF